MVPEKTGDALRFTPQKYSTNTNNSENGKYTRA
jgi:hypothetical protein